MPLSVEYIQSLGACWTPAQLAESAQSWPSPTPSWSWFLGERLAPLSRPEALLRVQVALAHVVKAKLDAPARPRAMHQFFRACTAEQFTAGCQALGGWLDAADGPSFDALSSVVNG